MNRKRDFEFGPLLAAVVLVFAAWPVTRNYYIARLNAVGYFVEGAVSELSPIEAEYSPERFSRNGEEWLIRDFFNDRTGGVYLDVGANHYRNEYDTYFLEQRLGWSAVATDALEEFAGDYAEHRPRTKFFVPDANTLVASVSKDVTVREGAPGKARRLGTTPLHALLEQAGIQKLDLVSMDIELSEPKALAGFGIDRFLPELVCVVAHPDVRQQILDYFTSHRDVVVGKYPRVAAKNLYFQRSSS